MEVRRSNHNTKIGSPLQVRIDTRHHMLSETTDNQQQTQNSPSHIVQLLRWEGHHLYD